MTYCDKYVPLYKYRSLGTDECRNRVVDIFTAYRLYAPLASQLNDPFECKFQGVFDASEDVKVSKAVQQIERKKHGISRSEALKLVPRYRKDFESNGISRIVYTIENQFRFISFGSDVDNLLMWSHYANSHQGIAIRFAAKHNGHADFFGEAFRVKYQDDLPEINFYTCSRQEIVSSLLLTKSSNWSYENEWRIVSQDEYRYFDPQLIDAVFMGCRTTEEDCEFILHLVAGLDVPVYQGVMSEKQYRINFCEVT